MSESAEDQPEPLLEGAGAWKIGRPLWWQRREPIEGATAKAWAEGGLLFILELVVVGALVLIVSFLEWTHLFGYAFLAILVGFSLIVVIWLGRRTWIRRNTHKQVIEWEAEHHRHAPDQGG